MTLGLLFWIASCLLALGLGFWLGMPGRYSQSHDEIEKIMEAGGGRRRKTKQAFTPLAWMKRRASANDSRSSRAARSSRRGGRGGFKLESPEDR